MAGRKRALTKVLDDLATAAGKGSSAQAAAALGDPLRAIESVKAAMAIWEKSGARELFGTDQEYAKHSQKNVRAQLVMMAQCNLLAIEALKTQLENGKIQDPKQLVSIVGELGRQIRGLADLDKEVSESLDPEKLDERIKQLESELDDGFDADTEPAGSA